MRGLFVLGRAIFGGFFVYSGYQHLRHVHQMAPYAQSKGVRTPEAAVEATGVMLVAGGLSVMTGLKPRHGLAALVAFLVPTTVQMHRFWDESDPQRRMNEMVNFSKNIALVGAALALMHVNEPWPDSIDEARAELNEEMFVRLGGRELRVVPA
jgi:putative oxidoreductase